MSSDQKVRAFLFYLSVAIFFLGLPLILSSTLGYKFDRRTFKFTKAGLIVLKTQPVGANVFLDGRPTNLKTPATINELLPGTYNIGLELEEHYPWSGYAEVEAGKVTKLEKIKLFPLRPSVKQLNKESLSFFLVDEEKDLLYYINDEEGQIYRSDFEGEHFEKVAGSVRKLTGEIRFKISPDRQRLAYFNRRQIGLTNLAMPKENRELPGDFILEYPKDEITDLFWHSDSYHLVVVTARSVDVLEAQPAAVPLTLVNLSKKDSLPYYDSRTDALYFLDSQKGYDGRLYDNLYKLQLDTRTFLLQDLIRPKAYEQKPQKQKNP